MTNPSRDPITEPVFVASSVTELEQVVELLDAHGIAFTTSQSTLAESCSGGAFRVGTAFHVLIRQAPFCRDALIDRGLGKGVVPAGVEERELTLT
jgi:hypothetical protein